MKKIFYSFMMLFMGIAAVCHAQQEASTVTEWNGSNKKLRMRPDSLITFSYTATANGTLYIYANDQNVSDNVHVNIWGGWYHDGGYDNDSPLQEAGSYENGVGVYGWIKVWAGDEIRFTLSTPKEAEGVMAMFTLKSVFFGENVKGGSWEEPIALTQGTKETLPVYKNYDTDYLGNLSYATFGRFVAPNDGVASIFTEEYLIYYIKEEDYGSSDAPLKYASQDISTNDHEFVVEKDKAYIVIVPNSRPTEVTFKLNSSRKGENCKAPIELTDLPASLDLVKGNNFFRIDLANVSNQYIMDLNVAAGWKGTITYLENCDYESEELLPADVNGTASYIHNLDPQYIGNQLIINFNVTNVANIKGAATISMREPKEGESFDKAIAIGVGENKFSGPARDYWFVYTANKDAELSVSSTGTIKHMQYSRSGGNIINEYNVYRIGKGQTIYICIASQQGDNTITLTEKAIEAGDYCDMPIVFELGENIVIKDRGDNVMNYRQFTAKESGFAIFETSSQNVIEYYWSIYFRQECGGKTISYVREDHTNTDGKVTSRSYKIPVTAGTSYLFEIMSFANDGANVIFTSRFEKANEGDVCATAIEISTLADTIDIDNTPQNTKWHKYVADKTGFYTTYAKIGRGSNLKIKVGDCNAEEINGSDDNRHNNAYMAGYKMCKVYVEQGQTLYIGTIINSDPGDTDGTNYYIVTTFAEARPGERFADPIKAEAGIAYTLTTGDEGYETWYTYTLPAGKETTIIIRSSTMKCYSSLVFYTDEKTSLSAYKEDFTQINITNDEGATIGKSYLFAAADTERTIYIKAPIATITEPVTWMVEKGNGGDGIDNLEGQFVATVYPNPTDGLFHINVPKATEATARIITTSGRLLYHTTLTAGLNTIDLRGQLASGIYLVIVNSNNQSSTSKLIVR